MDGVCILWNSGTVAGASLLLPQEALGSGLEQVVVAARHAQGLAGECGLNISQSQMPSTALPSCHSPRLSFSSGMSPRLCQTHFIEIDVGGRGPVPAVTCDNPHDFHTKLTQALAAKRAQHAPLPSEPQVHVHAAAAPVAV